MNTAELVSNIIDANELTATAAPLPEVIDGLVVGVSVRKYDGFDRSMDASFWGYNGFVVIFDGEKAHVMRFGGAGIDEVGYDRELPRYRADCRKLDEAATKYAALADEESAAQAQAWLEAKREQRAIEQANTEREREIERELQADKGRNVLVIKGDSAGTYGRCFWTGAKQVSYFSAILKLGIDAGGPRTEKGWTAAPIWTAAGNAVAIPEDCLGIFDADDVGNSGLAIAIAHVLDGLGTRSQYNVLQSLAASQVSVTLLRALGDDLRRAEAEWTACPKKGKGSTAAKRAAHGALEAVSKRIFQVVENAKG